MNAMDRALRQIVRGTGIFQVVLGITFWTGHALQFLPVHMIVGLVFVLSLWILAFRAALAGAGRGLAAFTVAWGAFVIVFGMTQAQIFPGEHHWVIRLLHLVVGWAAMGQGEALARRMKRTQVPLSLTVEARPA